MPPSRRLKIVLAYDGTEFHGWQVQPGLTTIQGILETILGGIEGNPVHVAGSGRTDAGVHAEAQVAAVTLRNPIPPDNLRKAVNRLLPPDIRILSVAEVAPDFHPRFDAVAKTYQYRIFRDEIVSPFLRRYVLHYPYPLQEDAMIAAAPLLVGNHDFTAFAASDPKHKKPISKVRDIFSSSIQQEESCLIYRVRGSGFLKHMVRNIVGVLLEVGKGNLGHSEIRARLTPGCGIPAGPTVLPSGLCLMSVEYPDSVGYD